MKIYATRKDKEEDVQRNKDKEAKESTATPLSEAPVVSAAVEEKKKETAIEYADYEMEALF
jgi:hypothetical protein